jgi:hypothetical protein
VSHKVNFIIIINNTGAMSTERGVYLHFDARGSGEQGQAKLTHPMRAKKVGFKKHGQYVQLKWKRMKVDNLKGKLG